MNIYTTREHVLNVSAMDAMVAHHALSIGLDRFITLEAQYRANPDAYAQSMADEYAERVRISTDVLAQMVKAFA